MNNWVFYGIFFCSLLLIVSVTVEAHAFDYFGCNSAVGKKIIKKANTEIQYCVSVETAKKLIERGWGHTKGLFFEAIVTSSYTSLDYEYESSEPSTAYTRPNARPIGDSTSYSQYLTTCPTGVYSFGLKPYYIDDCILELYNGTTIKIKPEKTFDTDMFLIQLPNNDNDNNYDASLTWDSVYRSSDTDPTFAVIVEDRLAVTLDFENHVGFHTLLDACGEHFLWDYYHENCRLVFYDGTIFDYKDNEWVISTELLDSNATITYNVNNIESHSTSYKEQTKTFEYRDELISHIDDCVTGITGQHKHLGIQNYVDGCTLRFDNGTTREIKPENTLDMDMFTIELPNNDDNNYDARLSWDLADYRNDVNSTNSFRYNTILNWDPITHSSDVGMMPTYYYGRSAVTLDFENHVGFHTLLDACGKRFVQNSYHENCRLVFYDGTTFEHRDDIWIMISEPLDSSVTMTYNTSSINYDNISLENNHTKTFKYDIDLFAHIDDCVTGISTQYNTPLTYVDDCTLQFDNGTTREIKPKKTFDTDMFLVQWPNNDDNSTYDAKLTKLVPVGGADNQGIMFYKYKEIPFATTFDFENHVGFHTFLNICDFSNDFRYGSDDQHFCRLVFYDGTVFVYRDKEWVLDEEGLVDKEWHRRMTELR